MRCRLFCVLPQGCHCHSSSLWSRRWQSWLYAFRYVVGKCAAIARKQSAPLPSHYLTAIQRRIAYGVILKTLSVQINKLVLPTVLTVGVLLRFNRRTQCFVKGKCVCCFASNVAGVGVLANYCTEVYIVLTYKSVKSVVEVSRCKFAVCIVTILDIIPFIERVANSCFENEVRQSEYAKSRPSTSNGSTKNNDSNFAM